MTACKKDIALFLLAVLPVCLNAQYSSSKIKNYKINLDTAATSVLPFDLPFTMVLKGDKATPFTRVYLFKVNRKRGWLIPDPMTSLQRKVRFFTWTDSTNRFRIIDRRIVGIHALQKIHYSSKRDTVEVDIPPLKPDKQYTMVGITEEKNFETMLALAKAYCIENNKKVEADSCSPSKPFPKENIRITFLPTGYFTSNTNTTTKLNKKKNKVEEMQLTEKKKQERKDRSELKKRRALEDEKLDWTKTVVPVKSLRRNFDLLDSTCDLCKKIEDDTVELKELVSEWAKGDLLPSISIQPCDSCAHSDDIFFLNGVLSLLDTWRSEVVTGVLRVDTVKSRDVIMMNFNSRATEAPEKLENTLHNSQVLNMTRQALNSLGSGLDSSSIAKLNFELDKYITALRSNGNAIREFIERRSKRESEVRTALMKVTLPVNWTPYYVANSTSTYQFVTRNSYFIKPDFGLVYYGDRLFSNKARFSGMAPFLGFHINLRATNSDVPFWSNMNWWKFPTIQIGVPIFAKDISDDGSRRHLVDNRFSIFTGIGFNVAHTARITFGSLFFKALAKSGSGGTNYKLAASPCISLGIDLRLRSLFQGLASAIQNTNAN